MSNLSDHETRMLNLQFQMKQNNEDLKSYLQELDSWESNIKEKEQHLSKEKKPEDTLPPVRNSLEKKKKKKIRKEGQSGSKKTKRISSYDYRAWDKFDVDAACDSKSSSGSEYETDEEWEVERKKQAAVLEKDKGNDYFKRGDYVNAIESYSRGAELDPTNPLLPANRAMAFLKQEKFAAAELDCSVALSLDPLYTKAYLRRGTARLGLKKYPEAKADYERVLQLEPQNKKAKADLELTEKELSKENMVTQTEPTVNKEAGIVRAISKAPHERSTNFLRRIEIEEVGVEDDAERRAAVSRVEASQSDAKKAIIDKDRQMFERFTANSPGDISRSAAQGPLSINPDERGDSDSIVTAAGSNKICDNKGLAEQTENLALNNIQANEEDTGKCIKRVDGTAHAKVPGISVIESPCQASTESESPGNLVSNKASTGSVSPRSVSSHKASTGSVSPGSTSPRSASSGNTSPRELSVPTSSVQFQTDFRLLKNDPEEFYKYFKKLHPSQFAKLFGQFLDAEVLLKILTVIKEFYIRDGLEYFTILQGLTAVKRFSMVAMFFSKKEKQVVTDIFSHLRSSGTHTEEEIKSLAFKYDIR